MYALRQTAGVLPSSAATALSTSFCTRTRSCSAGGGLPAFAKAAQGRQRAAP